MGGAAERAWPKTTRVGRAKGRILCPAAQIRILSKVSSPARKVSAWSVGLVAVDLYGGARYLCALTGSTEANIDPGCVVPPADRLANDFPQVCPRPSIDIFMLQGDPHPYGGFFCGVCTRFYLPGCYWCWKLLQVLKLGFYGCRGDFHFRTPRGWFHRGFTWNVPRGPGTSTPPLGTGPSPTSSRWTRSRCGSGWSASWQRRSRSTGTTGSTGRTWWTTRLPLGRGSGRCMGRRMRIGYIRALVEVVYG